MLSVLKVMQGFLDNLKLPEAMQIFTDLVWRLRWFIVSGVVLVGLYNVMMVALPVLVWSYVVKSGVSFLFGMFT
jgi:hypothetical protein